MAGFIDRFSTPRAVLAVVALIVVLNGGLLFYRFYYYEPPHWWPPKLSWEADGSQSSDWMDTAKRFFDYLGGLVSDKPFGYQLPAKSSVLESLLNTSPSATEHERVVLERLEELNGASARTSDSGRGSVLWSRYPEPLLALSKPLFDPQQLTQELLPASSATGSTSSTASLPASTSPAPSSWALILQPCWVRLTLLQVALRLPS